MNAEVVAVGTELLIGQIANTNAQYISQKLAEIGVNVYYHSVVGDNKDRIKDIINQALIRSDIIILTGGLGPTKDDITKETVSELLGIQMYLHKDTQDKMKKYFEKINKPMADSNLKQALIPEGGDIIQNNKGTAPGCVINFKNRIIVLLPGPPHEMKPMFDTFVEEYLTKAESVIASRYIKVFGLAESAMEEKIIDLIEAQSNPTIAPYCGDGEVVLRVTARSKDRKEAEELIMPVIEEIMSRIGQYVYSVEGKTLEDVIVALLEEKNKTISFAESCTGGMAASRLTRVPGVSKVFDSAVVTYSNEAKIRLLGVSEQALNKYGAVSHEIAKQMAEGVRKTSGTALGVGITGIAGPDGGTESKPTGLVYIGLADEDSTQSWEFKFAGDRERIRLSSVVNALDIVRRRLMKMV